MTAIVICAFLGSGCLILCIQRAAAITRSKVESNIIFFMDLTSLRLYINVSNLTIYEIQIVRYNLIIDYQNNMSLVLNRLPSELSFVRNTGIIISSFSRSSK